MKIPRWTIPFVLRILSLAGLTSAVETSHALAIGFALSTTTTAKSPTSSTSPSESQPSLAAAAPLSLELDFFVKVGNSEISLPVMPLHLLGKKSWNVYNTANIEKVRRDEAIARAKEEAEEQRLQEEDAARRMQLLRGEIPTPLAIEDAPRPSSPSSSNHKRRREDGGAEDEQGYNRREKKIRKKYGENDTDFEMRLASRQTADKSDDRQMVLYKDSKAPITDHTGHISLFPQDMKPKPHAEKNAEAEAELAKKKKEYEDQYTMRFSNAAGFKNSIGEGVWYNKVNSAPLVSRNEVEVEEETVVGKDVWGNEDPRRKEREAKRIVDNDPLASMKQGAAKVREVAKERKRWREEKDREIKQLEDEERRKKRRRRHDSDDDDLDDFRLDRDSDAERSRRKRERRRDEEDDRDRERSRREKHHRRSEHGHRDKYQARDRDEERYKRRRRSD